MKITQITFVAKNPKCVSIKPRRYIFNTSNGVKALGAAMILLKQDEQKNFDQYRNLPSLIIHVNEI
ncbi:MAG: hypothetical protein MJK15_03085 [Colwellia sp.]|nr:hypothetical protein [Colwellia sp.]